MSETATQQELQNVQQDVDDLRAELLNFIKSAQSKKISEMPPKASMVAADEFTILDSEDPAPETKNKRIGSTAVLASRQPVVPAGGATHLGKEPGWTPAGNSATRNVGTLATEVAAGDAPAIAVFGHESTYNHARIQTANQKAAADAASPPPSGPNPYATMANIPAVSGLHADLTDLSTSGHPGTVITISGGTQGNAVAIAADETLVDAGIPPGGGGGGGTQKGTPFVVDDLLAVQSATGDGIIKSVGFAPSDVARLSQSNTFTGEIQSIESVSNIALDLYKTGTTDRGRWEFRIVTDQLIFRSLSDSAFPIEASPELTIGHGSASAKGIVVGGATFQGYGTIAAQNGVYDGTDRVYSAGNPPPGGGGGIAKGTPFVVGDLLQVQADAGDGTAQSAGIAVAALWRDGSTIKDWGEIGQPVASTGNETFDLDNGHHFYSAATMTADKTINFQSTAGHSYTYWSALLDIGTITPTFQFNTNPIKPAEGYDISAGGLFWFTFAKSGNDYVVTERRIP